MRRVITGILTACLLVAVFTPLAAGNAPRCDGQPATIVGTNGADSIRGTAGADVIVARGGRDIIRARGGSDRVCAGGAGDRIVGSGGNDRIFGGGGADVITAGGGNDRAKGGPGADDLAGNNGDDKLFGEGGNDDFDGGTGTNVCVQGPGTGTMVNCGGSDPDPGGGPADFSVTLDGPTAVTAGDVFEFSGKVTNNGPNASVYTLTLGGITTEAAICDPVGGGGGLGAQPSLATNAMRAFDLQVQCIGGPGGLTMKATVVGPNDSNAANDVAEIATAVSS